MLTKIEQIRFNGFPQYFSIEDYSRQKEAFVQYFMHCSSVAAVYEFGSISTPGISDIDIMLVFENGSKLKDKDKQFLAKLDKYYFVHSPFVINRSNFSNLYHLFYLNNPNQLAGQKLTGDFPHAGELKEYMFLALCVESVISRLLDLHTYAIADSAVNIRLLLLKLHSLKHTLHLYQLATKNKLQSHWEEYVNRVHMLRKIWFNLDKHEQCDSTKELWLLALQLLIDVIQSLLSYLRYVEYSSDFPNNEGCLVLPNSLQIINFSKVENVVKVDSIQNPFQYYLPPSWLRRRRISKLARDISVLTIPTEFLIFFDPMFRIQSIHHRHLRDSIFYYHSNKNLTYRTSTLAEYIVKRFQFAEQYTNWFLRYEMQGMASFLMGSWLKPVQGKAYVFKKNFLRKLALEIMSK